MQRLLFLLGAVSALCSLRAETVLVLPFFNQSNAADLNWIGESISEQVRESLAAEKLLVLDREDRVEAFRRLSLRSNALLTRASVLKAGESLDASEVVYGQYDLAAAAADASGLKHGTLRITARIVNLKRFRQSEALRAAGALEDLAALESRLSWQILKALAPASTPAADRFLAARPQVRLDAMENYIRGLLAANPEQQNRFFTQAARLDPQYSQPCYQLGKWYWAKRDYRAAAGWLSRVQQADPHYMEAQFFLGLCDYHLGDDAGAVRCLQTVAAAVPLNEVYNDLGAAQAHTDPLAAIQSFRKALEGDSADPDYHFNLGMALWEASQFSAAADSFRAALERNPKDDEAAQLLARAERREPPRSRAPARERLKTNYEETAFRQLKAELESHKN
jgi:tetratricopeptide (TPR) repeat protein